MASCLQPLTTSTATAARSEPNTRFDAILKAHHEEGDPLRRVFFCPSYSECWWLRWHHQLQMSHRYLVSFVRVVVVPCIARPENWEHCRRVDRWLLPAVQDLLDFYTVKPYSKEQELLRAKDH